MIQESIRNKGISDMRFVAVPMGRLERGYFPVCRCLYVFNWFHASEKGNCLIFLDFSPWELGGWWQARQGENPECKGLMLLLVWKNVSMPSRLHAWCGQGISGSSKSLTTVAPKILVEAVKKFVLFRSLRAFYFFFTIFPLNVCSLFLCYVPLVFLSLLSAS